MGRLLLCAGFNLYRCWVASRIVGVNNPVIASVSDDGQAVEFIISVLCALIEGHFTNSLSGGVRCYIDRLPWKGVA